MSVDDLVLLGREALWLVLLLSAPPVLAALLVGFVSSVFQAATQVQDQTLGFVPKVVAVAVALGISAPWIARQAVRFTEVLYNSIGLVGQ